MSENPIDPHPRVHACVFSFSSCSVPSIVNASMPFRSCACACVRVRVREATPPTGSQSGGTRWGGGPGGSGGVDVTTGKPSGLQVCLCVWMCEGVLCVFVCVCERLLLLLLLLFFAAFFSFFFLWLLSGFSIVLFY